MRPIETLRATAEFVAERFKGGAYAVLAELVTPQVVEPPEPPQASITYYETPPYFEHHEDIIFGD